MSSPSFPSPPDPQQLAEALRAVVVQLENGTLEPERVAEYWQLMQRHQHEDADIQQRLIRYLFLGYYMWQLLYST